LFVSLIAISAPSRAGEGKFQRVGLARAVSALPFCVRNNLIFIGSPEMKGITNLHANQEPGWLRRNRLKDAFYEVDT